LLSFVDRSGGTPVKRVQMHATVCHDARLWRQQLVAAAGCLDMHCVEMVKITDILEELPPPSCVGGEMSVIFAILTRAVPGPRTFFPAVQHPGGEQVSAHPATPQEPQAVCALKVSVFCAACFSARGSSGISKLIHNAVIRYSV
jgi:hypothetical protein